MRIESTCQPSGIGVWQTAAGSSSAGLRPEDFLTLLVAELRNQDPLQPMDEREMIAQLAQLQSVAELQQIRSALEGTASGSVGAFALLGHEVSWLDENGQAQVGRVTQILRYGDNWLLQVGDTILTSEDVMSVSQ